MKRTNTMTKEPHINFVFFGTAPLALGALDALEAAGYVPSLIVAGKDRIDSRTKAVIFPPEKSWALAHSIEVTQPGRIDADFLHFLKAHSSQLKADVFIVASYGKLLPKALLDIPARGVLNVHPSLLPRLRGPSPIRSAILNDERETGISIIALDEEMDHGPIIAQKKVLVAEWPPHGKTLDDLLAHEGGRMLASILPLWIAGEVEAHPQNDDLATYCSTFKKEDGLIDLDTDSYQNLLKIRAFEGWPGTYTFIEHDGKQVRVKIIDAHIEGNALKIDRMIPEGKREMSFEEFTREH
jgi:methionyl-tRNA formyltransferase